VRVNHNVTSVAIRPVSLSSSLAAYFELTKPRVLAMILAATLAGFCMGSQRQLGLALALRTLLGTALAAGGTLALNQYLERHVDARMHRTRDRPLPSGRLSPIEGLIFGLGLAGGGIGYLCAAVNPLSAIIAGVISFLYLGVYTPMKRFSWLCHMIGGISGALPPVIGWAAVRGSLGVEPLVLFGIMLLWQLPHSLSIARLYQADYARAGLSLLPLERPKGNPVNITMLTATALLVGFATAPTWMGFAGWAYFAAAVLLGLLMLYHAILLVRADAIAAAARRVMLVSLVYLPVVLLAMVLDKT